MIIAIIVLIIDIGLTIGVVLCIAHCSSYITMVSSALDQGQLSITIEIIRNHQWRSHF